ncbi:MAG: Fic family protein [Myxococcaceae bacterium]
MSAYPALKRLKIPWELTISDSLLGYSMRIAEAKPFLDEHLGTPQELELLRNAKVRAVTYSNQIEGNKLGENEVTAVLEGKRIAGSKKDIREVKNYHDALNYAARLADDTRPLRLADMCDLQRLVTNGLIEPRQSGGVRTIPVSIINSTTGETIDSCPEPHELPDLLSDLWRWLDATRDMNPFTRAFAFHFIAVSIHPFADGNGRTARLMQHLLLLQTGQRLARFVPSETAIMRRRENYYLAIRQSRSLGRLDPVVEFLAECFASSAAEVVEKGRKLLRESAGRTPEVRQRRILANALKQADFSMKDVAVWMPNVPRRTLERDLAALVQKRMLGAKGRLKGRRYQRKK